MAKRTHKQKHNLHAVESDPEVSEGRPEETLGEFLREVHNESTLSAAEVIHEGDRKIPSLEWLREHFKTKSAVIRYLHGEGYAVKDISKHTGIRYQHVRNVLTTELKRGPNEPHSLTNSAAQTTISRSVENSVEKTLAVEKASGEPQRMGISQGDDEEEEE